MINTLSKLPFWNSLNESQKQYIEQNSVIRRYEEDIENDSDGKVNVDEERELALTFETASIRQLFSLKTAKSLTMLLDLCQNQKLKICSMTFCNKAKNKTG